MKMIYDVSDEQKLRKILDRTDIYMTCAVEWNSVALALKQTHKDGSEEILGHAMFHVQEEER